MEVRILRHNYLPSLYRQTTEKLPLTRLRREIDLTMKKVLQTEIPVSPVAKELFDQCMSHLLQYLKTNQYNLDCSEPPVYAGDVTPWTPYKKECPCYLIQMKVGKLGGTYVEPGYVVFPLSVKKDKKVIKVYKLDLRSDDKQHLSPKKMYKAVFLVFEAAIVKLKKSLAKSRSTLTTASYQSTETTKVTKTDKPAIVPNIYLKTRDKDLCLVMSLPGGNEVELIPTITVSPDGPFIVAKPFEHDENPASDMLWRTNFSPNEEHILNAVTNGDREQRINAAKILTFMCQKEWKLNHVTAYQVKNILMHEIDFQIDHSPRWQRFTPEECMHLILLKMLEFSRERFLPHFFEEDLNLWGHLTDRQFRFMCNELEQLTRDDDEMLKVISRIRVDKIDY
ncbi:uncharacterized protein LOC133194726 [Saccostrea echinata]|uniref:uncharacterized protein LOC133194726 n=1 Tax=Saccostrea echinata TaxID=191078 RepID=UPI002A8327FA|nr:uncharacterized protein LOC133194726 [Saccostrea echinata]